jgi:hypothetical protein
VRNAAETTPREIASPWRWMFRWIFHIASFVARLLWRLLSWSIRKAEKFEQTHPEYERAEHVDSPR